MDKRLKVAFGTQYGCGLRDVDWVVSSALLLLHLRNPLASPVRGARQNGHAPSHAFEWAQKAIYAGSMVISLDAGYRGDAEDFQPERQLIQRLLHSPTGLSFFFF